jgi:hypothetical protein
MLFVVPGNGSQETKVATIELRALIPRQQQVETAPQNRLAGAFKKSCDHCHLSISSFNCFHQFEMQKQEIGFRPSGWRCLLYNAQRFPKRQRNFH